MEPFESLTEEFLKSSSVASCKDEIGDGSKLARREANLAKTHGIENEFNLELLVKVSRSKSNLGRIRDESFRDLGAVDRKMRLTNRRS